MKKKKKSKTGKYKTKAVFIGRFDIMIYPNGTVMIVEQGLKERPARRVEIPFRTFKRIIKWYHESLWNP